MAEKTNENNKELFAIPKICQYKNLGSPKNQQLRNETPDWLKDQGSIPVWSRLKPLSWAGQLRETVKSEENNFTVEIPGRLFSLFGSASQRTEYVNKMATMAKIHLMSNIFALCAALKNDVSEWSDKLLDTITTTAIAQYPDFMKEHSLRDHEVAIQHFNGVFNFNGDRYVARIHQVATGLLYIPFGLNQLNLARALNWFFGRYQFGFIKCGQRTLAMAKILNNEHDFLMYDCQSWGYPMFAEQEKNSYILKTNYLQILHYCLLKTLNFVEKMNFTVYNVDVTIINPLEESVARPVANNSKKKLYEKKVTNGVGKKVQKCIQNKVEKKVQKGVHKGVEKSGRNAVIGRRPGNQSSSTNSKQSTFNSQENHSRKIIIDPNKMYYIVAVPKTNLVTAKVEPRHLIIPGEVNNQADRFLESITLEKSASRVTLMPDARETNVIKNSENLGLKVYLVANEDGRELTEPKGGHKIKITHQLKDFFIK